MTFKNGCANKYLIPDMTEQKHNLPSGSPSSISFEADKVKITGPKVDGGFSVTFEAGEYMQSVIAQILLIPQLTTVKVTVEVSE